ncbi:TetR/AcrR family transcriptional regulator [Polymorphospora sp. NPDC050346]|uniref:TetR/AcrR family transcriptional regulator n=1 Tax=Polymorphospora sp. NPDC050346 TaxID=3155780 RepID=UPI00340B5FA4
MASTEGARPYHHGDLRAALLTQARVLLDRDGADAISFRAVARAAGVSPTAPYNHFANRRDLLAALAVEGFTALAERQRAAATTGPAGAARLVALGRAYLDFAAQQPQLYRLMFGTGVQHWHDIPAVAAAKTASFQPIRTTITEHHAARGSVESIEIAAVGAWSYVHGLAMLLIDGSLDRAREGVAGTDLATVALRWFVGQAMT